MGAEHRLRCPAELLGHEPRRVSRVLPHELERTEERSLALPDRVGLLDDGILGRVLDLTDPLRRHRVQAQQDLGLALKLGHRAAVAPDIGRDLLASHGRELRVEPAEADDLHVPVRVPAFLLGEHAREDPRRGARAGDADRLALEVADPLDVVRDVQREVVALGVRRDHLDRRAGLAEDENVGAAADPDETLAGHHGLEQIRAAAKRHELGGEPLGLEEALLESDDDGSRHRVVAEHRGADLDRGLRAGDAREDGGRCRGQGPGDESAACDHGHGRGLLITGAPRAARCGRARPAGLDFHTTRGDRTTS